MATKVKNIVFFLLMAILALPIFQHVTKFFDAGNLNGDFTLNIRPQFSWTSWMDGTYQAKFDRYIEDHIGFRNFFVRLNNQIDFTCYDEVNAEGIVKGKNKVLYEYDYIRALIGDDFIGENAITRKMNKLKYLQKYLKNTFNIDLILIFEPGKARVQPQFIPDKYLKKGKKLSNYECFKQNADDLNIDYIDLNQYFIAIADTAKYPVYPPYGIHWSEYTMRFVTDTLVRYIEKKHAIDLPDFRVETRLIADSISDSDYDAGKTSNLLFRLPQPIMPYPFFTFYDDQSKKRPMVLAVADSYYWNIFNTDVPQHLFANQAFWYFNAKVYPDFYYHDKWTSDLNIREEVEKQNVILLGITERFLYKFGWEFVDQLYEFYTPKYSGNLIEKKEEAIRNYSTWFDKLVKRASSDQNQTLAEIIHNEAIYLAMHDNFDQYLLWHGQEYYENIIRKDSLWNKSVIEKAIQKGSSYQKQLSAEAAWNYEKNHPEIFLKNSLISQYRHSIQSDTAWLKNVKQKAQKYYMPLNDMINIDAEYLTTELLVNETPFDKRVRHFEKLITSSPDWMEKIVEKARIKNIPVNRMLKNDAIYMAEQEQKKNK